MERIVQTFFFYCLYKLEFPQTTLPNFHWILGQYILQILGGEPWWTVVGTTSPFVHWSGTIGALEEFLWYFQADYFRKLCSMMFIRKIISFPWSCGWAPRKVTNFLKLFCEGHLLITSLQSKLFFLAKSNLKSINIKLGIQSHYLWFVHRLLVLGSVTPLYLRMARGFARQAPRRVTEQIPGGLGYWASDSAGPFIVVRWFYTGQTVLLLDLVLMTIRLVGYTRLFLPEEKSMNIIISPTPLLKAGYSIGYFQEENHHHIMISFKIRLLKAAAMSTIGIISYWGESRGGSGWSPWALQIACFVVSWAAQRWRKWVLNDLIYILFYWFLLWFLIIFLTHVIATAIALLISFLEFFGISIITFTVVVMITIVLLCFIVISWCNQNC